MYAQIRKKPEEADVSSAPLNSEAEGQPVSGSTSRDAGRDGLPLTLVAMDLEGQAIGAVTLGSSDDAPGLACGERAPWVVRMVVRPGERMCGVGRLMMAAVEDLAREHGHDRLWVAASDDHADFYRHCGWADAAPLQDPVDGSRVLSKELTVVA